MGVLMNKYQEIFLSESYEHLDALDAGLIEFEKDPANEEVAAELMRHAHTFKGIAASMEYGEISNLSHSFEGMVENIKNKLSSIKGISLLFGAVDELRKLVEDVERGDANIQKANTLVDRVGELEHDDLQQDAKTVAKPETFTHVQEVKVKAKKLDKMVDLAAEILISKLRLEKELAERIGDGDDIVGEVLSSHARLIEDLQYQVLQLRLTPLVHVFNRFPRMVRDLAKKEEKKVEFIIRGGDIELDRSVLDGLGEPLVHLLRNAVDHGIASDGKITLDARREQDHVLITVHNTDGSIDWDAVEKKAKEMGRFEKGMSKEDMLFSGLSTAEEVTEVSGRGVGLSVVKEKVEELDGSVSVTSSPEEGTSFFLRLPVSLAIIKALMVGVSDQLFAVPLTSVERLVSLGEVERSTQADQDVAVIDEEEVPLIQMRDVLNIVFSERGAGLGEEGFFGTSHTQTALLVRSKDALVGLLIDSVESQQDIIVKPLSKSLRDRGYFSAVTILGDGNPVPILDLDSVLKLL